MDFFVEDLWNIHDLGARYQESQDENSRQVQEFNFKIGSFVIKGLDEDTRSRKALVNTNCEKTNTGTNSKDYNPNGKAIFYNRNLIQDPEIQILKQSFDSSELHNEEGFII